MLSHQLFMCAWAHIYVRIYADTWTSTYINNILNYIYMYMHICMYTYICTQNPYLWQLHLCFFDCIDGAKELHIQWKPYFALWIWIFRILVICPMILTSCNSQSAWGSWGWTTDTLRAILYPHATAVSPFPYTIPSNKWDIRPLIMN